MALTRRLDGNQSNNLVTSQWWNDFYDLLTGAMTDQAVSIANNLTAKKFVANGTLSAANQVADLQQNFGIFSDNTATTFGGATSRLWFQAGGTTGTQEMHLGPRAGNSALAGLRVLANNFTLTNNGSGVNGAFSVTGGITTSLDSGKLVSDGTGKLSFLKTLGGANQTLQSWFPSDGTKEWRVNYNTDGTVSFFDATDNKVALKLLTTGGILTDNGAHTTDGSGNISTTGGMTAGGSVTAGGLTVKATSGATGVELGDTSRTTDTPFLDFHAAGGTNDYDVRLITTGGIVGTNAKGTLNIQAGALQLNGTAVPVLSGGGATITVSASASPPASPKDGDLWVKRS